jgi:hypothetical protein
MIGSPVGKHPMNLNSRSSHIARHDVAACEWKHIETASGTVQIPAFSSVFQPGGVGGACLRRRDDSLVEFSAMTVELS